MNPLVKTGLTHAGTAIGGAMAVATFMASSKVDLYAIWDQMNVVIAGVTKLVALLTPFATTAYGIYRTTAKARLVEVAADPKSVEAAKELPITPETVKLANALKE